MNRLAESEKALLPKPVAPGVRPGDQLRVHVKIAEGDKTRIQAYEGTVIAVHNNGASSTFTVRKVSNGVGVERVFPLYTPWIEKVELTNRYKVRRAKLYFLRKLAGKAARLKEVRR